MKVISLFIFILFICCFPQSTYSQNWSIGKKNLLDSLKIPKYLNKEYVAITVSKNDRSRDLIPAKQSERFKVKFTIDKDTAFFTLKAEKFRYGKHIDDPLYGERITYWPDLCKEDVIFFEIVPDISRHNQLILFTYFPVMTSFKFMNCPEDKYFKYKLFKRSTDKIMNKGALLLIYVDDKNNKVENLVNRYSKNNLITDSPDKYKKLLDNIELYMLVHYTIEYKK